LDGLLSIVKLIKTWFNVSWIDYQEMNTQSLGCLMNGEVTTESCCEEAK